MDTSYITEHRKVTYSDYASWPDDGKRYEIIEGEVFMTPAPRTVHQRVLLRIYDQMKILLEGKGEILIAPCDIVFDQYNVVQPDLLFISKSRIGIIGEDNIQGAPDLVVEILSPSTNTRDLLAKRDLYEKFQVKEYWVLDPGEKQADIFLFQKDRFVHAGSFRRGARVATPLLEGKELDLTLVWP